jgi:hypothetical protein
MDSIDKLQTSYRVEVSGWDASEEFFVEKTTLNWRGGDQKEINLRAGLREGCVLFVRLLQSIALVNNIPIAYQAAKVMKRDAKGRTRASWLSCARRTEALQRISGKTKQCKRRPDPG